MKITVMTSDDQFITLDVDSEETVENVKALLEVETSVSLNQQQLHFNGKEMSNRDKLSSTGVTNGDMIMMVSTASSSGPPANNLRINHDGSATNPGAFQQHVRQDSQMMAQLLQNDPPFAQAILGENLDTLQNLLRERHQQRLQLRRKEEEELALMYADPFDVEAQKKIEAAIRQRGINENWEAALEYNPEGFARVVMLYVDMEVNGVPLKAFVDSGAQSTIISKSCAERCGLLRLLDQRYRGVAVGVGQSEILGRIHVAQIKIGHLFYHCSFTVLDAPNMEFLFGLDMLRKHQCIIDLKDNMLRVGGGEVSVPFLQEKDIPLHQRDEAKLASLGQGSSQEISSSAGNKSASAPSLGQSSGAPQNIPSQKGQLPKYLRSWTPQLNSPFPTASLVVSCSLLGHDKFSANFLRNSPFPMGGDFELKITKLVELGFDRESVIQALKLFNGNEEQAAGFLFGG